MLIVVIDQIKNGNDTIDNSYSIDDADSNDTDIAGVRVGGDTDNNDNSNSDNRDENVCRQH
jgi:hypothetical protein